MNDIVNKVRKNAGNWITAVGKRMEQQHAALEDHAPAPKRTTSLDEQIKAKQSVQSDLRPIDWTRYSYLRLPRPEGEEQFERRTNKFYTPKNVVEELALEDRLAFFKRTGLQADRVERAFVLALELQYLYSSGTQRYNEYNPLHGDTVTGKFNDQILSDGTKMPGGEYTLYVESITHADGELAAFQKRQAASWGRS